jgi:L-rhamnose mutarotase
VLHCYLLDLQDDAALIEAYQEWHRPGRVPEDVLKSIRDSGVQQMEIYRLADRLVMIMKTDSAFDPSAKAAADAANPAVAAWEAFMAPFQKPLPMATDGEKWLRANRIFDLEDHH